MEFLLKEHLALLVFFPLLGIPIVLLSHFFDRTSNTVAKVVALVIMVLEFVLSISILANFNAGYGGMQFEVKVPWIPSLGVSFHLGVDGISLFLILLTTFVMPLAVLSAWNAIGRGMLFFLSLMLFLESALVGTFTALDLILFFVFWEAVLIPMYFIIGIWGTERRVYAALKFFVYTALGSALMLVAIFYLYFLHVEQFGTPSMGIADMYRLRIPFYGVLSPQGVCFLAFFLAFAIKVPLFPFHTWLPDAHVEAPTSGSVVLAAILLKMGGYGFLRFLLPLFPDATLAFLPYLAALSIIGVIYGALVAFAQSDLKKLVAYSSVSHMGLVILGVFALNIQGTHGAVYQMLGHGLSTGALFIVVGMLYERRHTKLMREFGGVARVMPIFAAFFLLATLSSIGLPLLNGFVGEFLILLGVFRSNHVWGVLGATG
ncbi:MAG: NADH-quinone oxidoreductase subunit M, partial [Candidatus Methanosuratincola sp.]